MIADLPAKRPVHFLAARFRFEEQRPSVSGLDGSHELGAFEVVVVAPQQLFALGMPPEIRGHVPR
jgi:hypothetical protein